MQKYSVAIRTLGKSGELLKRELESLQRQTIKPEQVVIYIAQGYERPTFQVADERYVWVQKGMMAQQALNYNEIDSPLILKLDDDVELTRNDDAESLVRALKDGNYDCVAADTFKNHRMTAKQRIYSLLTGWVRPHLSQEWAFKVTASGSFTYQNKLLKDVYPSQSAAGPCSLWRKDALIELDLRDELWIDQLGFAYGDDQLIFYKLYTRGGHLGVAYNTGIEHRDGRTSSDKYRSDIDQYRTRAMGQTLVWHRSIYSTRENAWQRLWCATAFTVRMMWQLPVHCVAAVKAKSWRVPSLYLKGLRDATKYIKSTEYKQLPSYR